MKTLLKMSSYGLVLALMIITARPALSDEYTTTTMSSDGSSVVTVSSTESAPSIVITNKALQPCLVGTHLSGTPTPIIMRDGTITGFLVWKPDDLVTRRDDLLARIAVEHACGKLSADQSSNLIARVQDIDKDRAKLTGPFTTSYFHQVKLMYRSYDRLSNDIRSDTKEGDKQLAGRYNFLTL